MQVVNISYALSSLPKHITSPYVFWQEEDGKKYMDVRRSFRSALKRAGMFGRPEKTLIETVLMFLPFLDPG